MKKHNLLLTLILATGLIACNDKNKSEKVAFSINTGQLKQLYRADETLKLTINNNSDTPIDSVAYYLNDKKIGSVPSNSTLEYVLQNEKLGFTYIKAQVYHNATSNETLSRIELAAAKAPKILKYRIINTYPHDMKAYTQGLEFYNGILFESTGNGAGIGTGTQGTSSVRKVDYKTGKVLQIVELPQSVFGEGLTILNNKVYQLTYKNNEAYMYNIETLEREKVLPYFKDMEGWGLTNDGANLYMTNGSEKIYIVNPETLEPLDHINIYTHNMKIEAVNELEWVDGKIYANFYGSPAIGIIDPKTGAVEAVADFSDLYHKVTSHPDLDVFNGVAYNPTTQTFFVTGKNWDKMFEIEFYEE